MVRLLGGSIMGLMETSSKRVYATPCATWVCCSQSLCPCRRPWLNHASTGDTQTPKGQPGSVSVGSLGTGAQKVSFEPFWASLVGMGCDTKWGFAPPTVFLGLLSLRCGMSFFGGVQHSPVNSCSLASCSFGVLAGEDECTSIYSSILLSLFLNICTHIIYTCAYIHTYTYMSTCCCSLLSSVWLFVTPWTASCQDSLSLTVSRNLLRLMSIELVMPSNHLILCHHLLLPSILPSIRVFSNESALCIRWPNYWNISFSISSSSKYSGLISFRIDWFDLPSVQATLKSLLQHHILKAPILWCSYMYAKYTHTYMSGR